MKTEATENFEGRIESLSRDLADSVRDYLDLKDHYRKVLQENRDLKEAAIKALQSALGGASEDFAEDMFNAWLKTVGRPSEKRSRIND